jgi:hypothetical protein
MSASRTSFAVFARINKDNRNIGAVSFVDNPIFKLVNGHHLTFKRKYDIVSLRKRPHMPMHQDCGLWLWWKVGSGPQSSQCLADHH